MAAEADVISVANLRMWGNKAEKKSKRGGAADGAMDAYLQLADKVLLSWATSRPHTMQKSLRM